jgi:D-3-phosphoglycerate dehydrogenase
LYCPDPTKEEFLSLCKDKNIDIIYTNPNSVKFVLNQETLPDSIKFICTASTGTNHIDMLYTKEKGIKVISLTQEMDIIERITSTAEHALALTLSLIRNLPASFKMVLKGEWNGNNFRGRQASSLTVGIVGAGRLGKIYSKLTCPLFKEVLFYDPYVEYVDGAIKVQSLGELFKRCDVVSLHVHVKKDTIGMIDYSLLSNSRCKYLINTSRGQIVNESDIILALENKDLLGYATDVLCDEIDEKLESPIIDACIQGKNIIITPHIGGTTKEAQELAYNHVVKMLLKEIS